MQKAGQIWVNGKFVPWNEANISIQTHSLHYGLGVFEGIRCYKTDKGPGIFRLKEHLNRFFNSARIAQIKIPFSKEELFQAIIDTIKVNHLDECYIRPLAFVGSGRMGLNPIGIPIQVSITVWPWGAYLGEEGIRHGVKTIISSYTRTFGHKDLHQAKICGNYVLSQLAKMEAISQKADESILLDSYGHVAEGSGENIFIVQGEIIKTPPLTHILEGITRDTVMKLAKHHGWKVQEEYFTKESLYSAQEIFFTGTAAEMTPIRQVDDHVIGEPGKVFKLLYKDFQDLVRGKLSDFSSWITFPNLI